MRTFYSGGSVPFAIEQVKISDQDESRAAGNNEEGDATMTFITSVQANDVAASPTKGSQSLLRRILDLLAEAQMRQAEREVRRFRHLHDVAWESDVDRPMER
jgi:hypothetical protein